MTFFALLAAILFEHFYPLPPHRPVILTRAIRYLADQMNTGKPQDGLLAWLIVIIPLSGVTSLVYFALSDVSLWLAWLWNIAILYLCIRFKISLMSAEQIHQALLGKDLSLAQQLFSQWRATEVGLIDAEDLSCLNLEAIFTDSLQHLFGVIFWFVLLSPLGPIGAVLYRTTVSLSKHWQIPADGAFAVFPQYMRGLADWLPSRAAALSFAIAGNFEDALYCWRSQAIQWPDPNQGILLASGAGALGIKLGMPIQQGALWRPELGLGERADNSYFSSTQSLIWRALVIWFFLLLLMALAKLAR